MPRAWQADKLVSVEQRAEQTANARQSQVDDAAVRGRCKIARNVERGAANRFNDAAVGTDRALLTIFCVVTSDQFHFIFRAEDHAHALMQFFRLHFEDALSTVDRCAARLFDDE